MRHGILFSGSGPVQRHIRRSAIILVADGSPDFEDRQQIQRIAELLPPRNLQPRTKGLRIAFKRPQLQEEQGSKV